MKRVFACFCILLFLSQVSAAQDLVPFQDSDKKCGYKDAKTGRIVVPAKFEKVAKFRDDQQFALVVMDSKRGLINRKGDLVLACKHDFLLRSKKEGVYHLRIDDKWALLNSDLETIVDFVSEKKVRVEKNGLLLITKNGKCGFWNSQAETVVPLVFDKAGRFKHGGSIVWSNGKAGVISPRNKIILPNQFSDLYHSAGYIIANENGLYGIYDTLGNTLQQPRYQEISKFSDGKFFVKKGDRRGYWENGVETLYEQKPLIEQPDVPAKFRKSGNPAELIETFYASMRYPPHAKEEGVEGLVVITCIIDVDGTTMNHEVTRGIGGGCEEEVIRVLKTMKWEEPAMHEGEYVRTILTFPARFKLE